MLRALKFHLDRASGYNKGNVSRNIQPDNSVACTDKQEGDERKTLSLVFLRDAEPDMWSSIHISEGSI